MSGRKNIQADREWEDILDSIEFSTSIPIEYISAVFISFSDGTVWDIKTGNENFQDTSSDEIRVIEDNINELIEENLNEIDLVEYRLDTKRIKKDIQKKTRKFVKQK